jgi:hypothetical protein
LVRIPFTPKPAGLDPQNFLRHTSNWMRKINSQKNQEKFPKMLKKKKKKIEFFHENAQRSGAFGECLISKVNKLLYINCALTTEFCITLVIFFNIAVQSVKTA